MPRFARTEITAALVAVLAVMPFLVLAVAALTRDWFPTGDPAVAILQTGEVGTANTPLLGTWSRWGWNHPGPSLFYFLAPFTWLAGNPGVLAAVALVNAAAVALTAVITWRRGGLGLLTIAVGGQVLLALRLGSDFLIDPWNPFVPILTLFTFALACWAVAERDIWFLPVAVCLGSLSIQAHVGLGPLVMGLLVVGVALSWRSGEHRQEPALLGPDWRLPVGVSAALGTLLWLPPLIEEIRTDPGNFTLLFRYTRNPTEPPVGLSTAWRVMTAHLDIPPGWLRGLDEHGHLLESSLMAVVTLAVALALGAMTIQQGCLAATRLMAISLAAVLIGMIAVSRMTGDAYAYLLRPWWSIGALLCLSMLWSAWVLVRDALIRKLRAPIRGAAIGGAVLVFIALLLSALRVQVPFEQESRAVASLGPVVREKLPDEDVTLRWIDMQGFGLVGTGLLLYLQQDGVDAYASPQYAPTFDDRQVRRPEEVGASVVVVSSDNILMGAEIPPDADPVAGYDPLTVGQRSRHDDLWRMIAASVESETEVRPVWADEPEGRDRLRELGADSSALAELAALREMGSGYVVFLVDHPW